MRRVCRSYVAAFVHTKNSAGDRLASSHRSSWSRLLASHATQQLLDAKDGVPENRHHHDVHGVRSVLRTCMGNDEEVYLFDNRRRVPDIHGEMNEKEKEMQNAR